MKKLLVLALVVLHQLTAVTATAKEVPDANNAQKWEEMFQNLSDITKYPLQVQVSPHSDAGSRRDGEVNPC